MPRLDAGKAQKIREDIQRWDNSWKYNKAIYHEMTQFILGEQWKEDEAKLFETYKKIPLTVNKIAPLANHLLGEQRQNTPNLQVQGGEDVPEPLIEVRDALVKEISLNSNAKIKYQNCFQQAAIGGYSAGRIGLEYESDDSFNQDIVIDGFIDPTKCFWDLGAVSPCKTDGMYAGFRTTMTRRKFRSEWGKQIEKKIGSVTTDVTDTEMITMAWSDENSITVIDYFERKSKIRTIYQLSDALGTIIDQKEFSALEKIEIEGQELLLFNGEPVTVLKKREVVEYRIKHSKWGGDYELESADFPSKQLPVVFLDQNSYYDKNGKQITRPFFKDARDSQRYVNYLRTQMAYLVKISRYDQFIVSKQNVKSNDTQAMWRDPANVQGALYYDESPNGDIPQQLRPPELSQSLLLEYAEAAKDIQVTCGMFDTQVGEQGNEISGDAIDARTKRGSYNTYLPFDSLNRFIACLGSIVDEMIPSVYDSERVMNLEMKDKGRTKITLNKPLDEYGMQTENDMSQGKFKIRLIPGASQEGQKQENLMSMDRMMQHDPESFKLVADLYAENLPIPNSTEIRNRYRTLVPPEIIEAGKTGQPLPPKEPQMDPALIIKQQELQLKAMTAQQDMMHKEKQLNFEMQKLMMQSHESGIDFTKEIAKLQHQKEELHAQLEEQKLRYSAEMSRINADMHQHHTGNILKILTHEPDHLSPKYHQSNKKESKE